MKKENRLRKRKQFNWTFKNGKSVYSKDLVLVFTSSKSKDYKVGFSVTKKVGKAVVRNKIKRRLKNIVTNFQNNIAGKSTMIFVAKPTAIETDFEELKSQVVFLLKKANLFKETENIEIEKIES